MGKTKKGIPEAAHAGEEDGIIPPAATIIRQYNYRLETGTVGTDDENIASILYNINQMEKNASFASSDVKKLDGALGELFFLIVDAKVHLGRFLQKYSGQTQDDTARAVSEAFDSAIQIIRAVRGADGGKNTPAKMAAVFPEVYKKLLDCVPFVLALDAQSAGKGEP